MMVPLVINIDEINEEEDPTQEEIDSGNFTFATRYYLKIQPPIDCPSNYLGIFNRTFKVPKYGYLSSILRLKLPPSRTIYRASDYIVEYWEWKKCYINNKSYLNKRLIKTENWNIPPYSNKRVCHKKHVYPRRIIYPRYYLYHYSHITFHPCINCFFKHPENDYVTLVRKDNDDLDVMNYDGFPQDQAPFIYENVTIPSYSNYKVIEYKEPSPYNNYIKEDVYSGAGILWLDNKTPRMNSSYQVKYQVPLGLDDIKRCSDKYLLSAL